MSGTPKDHDFDWVSARLDCCEGREFVRLRDLVERDCARRHRALRDRRSKDVKFVAVKDGRETFYVDRVDFPESDPEIRRPRRSVRFELMDGRICVREHGDAGGRCMSLTVRLDDQGECRVAIDGDGEYLRWQVIRRAQHSLLFDPSVG